jgi:hypothetical protein
VHSHRSHRQLDVGRQLLRPRMAIRCEMDGPNLEADEGTLTNHKGHGRARKPLPAPLAIHTPGIGRASCGGDKQDDIVNPPGGGCALPT